MTAEDLAEGKIAIKTQKDKIVDPKTKEEKIIYQYTISPRELGLLLVKYNKILLSKTDRISLDKFVEVSNKLISSFNTNNSEDLAEEKNFLNSCLALCDNNLSLAFLQGENDVEKITNVHRYVCERINVNEEAKKETIGEARMLDDMDNRLRKESKIYGEHQKAYKFMSDCINDEVKFESLYKTFNGRIPKEDFRKKLVNDFSKENGIRDNFLQQQSEYFNSFIKFRLMADRRLINPANSQKIEEKVV